MLESLYRAGFNIADEQLDDDARRMILRRVHEGAEVRLTGGYADGSGASKTDPAGPFRRPRNTGVLKYPEAVPAKVGFFTIRHLRLFQKFSRMPIISRLPSFGMGKPPPLCLSPGGDSKVRKIIREISPRLRMRNYQPSGLLVKNAPSVADIGDLSNGVGRPCDCADNPVMMA
jgi:hypothetical protein